MTQQSVVFLTSSHSPFDDRILYHLATSLSIEYHVFIIATTESVNQNVGNIELIGCDGMDLTKRAKIDYFFKKLNEISPSIIISSDPLPILAASRYRKAHEAVIIYDVTEWYPSKKNLQNFTGIKKVSVFFKLLIFNLFVSFLVDGFLFGEYYKSLPYKLLFFYKRMAMVSYYPDLSYIKYTKANLSNHKICLGYTGQISIEKGIKNLVDATRTIKNKRPDLNVKLKIIGWFNDKTAETGFNDLIKQLRDVEIELLGRQKFEEFSEKIQDVDIFFDLREIDMENTHCLPIKLFYYAACGRPVIYSNLKAIKRVIEVEQFGYLVDPSDANLIADYILGYTNHPFTYYRHCTMARTLAEKKYNWKLIEPTFINFIKHLRN